MTADQCWPVFTEHLEDCTRRSWALIDVDGWTVGVCRGCGARRLLLPDEVDTPAARYAAGRPQHRDRRGAR